MRSPEIVSKVEAHLYPRLLSRVQVIVLQESWDGKSYRAIARTHGYNEGFIRNVGAELWQLLTDAIGQKVTKSTLKWRLQMHFYQTSGGVLVNSTTHPVN